LEDGGLRATMVAISFFANWGKPARSSSHGVGAGSRLARRATPSSPARPGRTAVVAVPRAGSPGPAAHVDLPRAVCIIAGVFLALSPKLRLVQGRRSSVGWLDLVVRVDPLLAGGVLVAGFPGSAWWGTEPGWIARAVGAPTRGDVAGACTSPRSPAPDSRAAGSGMGNGPELAPSRDLRCR
jgi:hypothetical protein